MAQAPFIGGVLPESKNTAKEVPIFQTKTQKGLGFELSYSAILHHRAHTIPLLVSPQVLRGRGCGQMDLAYFLLQEQRPSLIYLCELKSRPWVPKIQQRRLVQSAAFVASIFKLPVKLEYVLDVKENFAKRPKLF